ncbi:MAG: ATP synthase F1 subunit gamma [Candidatus Alcyoniella australis]|nr:ATP synthase F1 subunit gamma [Candidatus Alcyoniella australis]
MANLRHIRKRISSVKSTQQITRAMKMVAAAKLRSAEMRLKAARPYAWSLDEMIRDLLKRTGTEGQPLLKGREQTRKVELVVVTSDRGLCGAFNSSILRQADGWLRENADKYEQVTISAIGRKARDHFKHRNYEVRDELVNALGNFDFSLARRKGRELIELFMSTKADTIYLTYNEFVTAVSQKVVTRKLIPCGFGDIVDEADEQLPERETYVDYRYEPSRPEVLSELLPLHIDFQLYRAFLESFAAEMGARMSSMESATNNAVEMIGRLTLQYNRARQDAITSELLEIINGAEALKG